MTVPAITETVTTGTTVTANTITPNTTIGYPGVTTAPDATVTVPTAVPATAEPAPTMPDKKSLADLIAALPDDDQKIILDQVTKARGEAKNYRTQLREADPAKVRSEVLAEIAKAIGVEETPPDPATLARQLSEQTSAATGAQRELAVFRAAGAAGADPAALLDSVSFMRTLADADVSDANAVTEAIKAAVAANPGLAVTPGKRAPAPNPALGAAATATSGGGADLDAQIADARKRGDVMTEIRLQNQKLAPATR